MLLTLAGYEKEKKRKEKKSVSKTCLTSLMQQIKQVFCKGNYVH